MIDLIFLAFNRLEFTKASMAALIANTEWNLVRKFIVYDDGSTDGTREYLKSAQYPHAAELIFKKIGGPVAITKHYLAHAPAEIFAKIDNDTMLPPFWLSECLKVMEANKKLDLLGIEAFYPVQAGQAQRGFVPAKHIGGIGLMRPRCFKSMPKEHGPGGRFGFTGWQIANKSVSKGWINPALPVFLLDRMPTDPWLALSQGYVKKGWQRDWKKYTEDRKELWSWWK